MPINKETIISVYDEKLTLMQWLKTINKALDEAVLTGVEIAKKGNATLSFKFTFEDGTFLESNDIVLQQGESINGAYIQNGHLYLTLTNSQTLDAGNVKPVSNFAINGSQHLIVNYADGTSQDLGAIFQGNVNISGTLNATKITGDEIVETMSGYTAYTYTTTGLTLTILYAGVVKTGNKITFAVAFNAETDDNLVVNNGRIIQFIIPTSIGEKLYPSAVLGGNTLDSKKVNLFSDYATTKDLILYLDKGGGNNSLSFWLAGLSNLTKNTTYFGRYEATFLLSNSLIQ